MCPLLPVVMLFMPRISSCNKTSTFPRPSPQLAMAGAEPDTFSYLPKTIRAVARGQAIDLSVLLSFPEGVNAFKNWLAREVRLL